MAYWMYILMAYIVGSVVFGQLAALVRGERLSDKDTPGGSGAFRQYGAAVGVLVIVLDIAKGAVVGVLCPAQLWAWAGVALLLGHLFPMWFKFKGGGGIAPTIGFFLAIAPALTLWAWLVALVVSGAYWKLLWKRHSWSQIYPIPVGALFGFIALLTMLASQQQHTALLAMALMSVVVLLRGLVLKG